MSAIRGNRVEVTDVDDVAGGERYPHGALQVWASVRDLEGWEIGVTVPLAGDSAYIAAELIVRPIAQGAGCVPEGGVQAATLRSIPVAEILRAAFRKGSVGSMGWYINSLDPTAASEVLRTAKGGRPRHYTDQFYAQVALDWEAQTAQGSGALGRLAAERCEPQSTVKNWIQVATERGFLHKATTRGPRPRRATQLAIDVAARSGEDQ